VGDDIVEAPPAAAPVVVPVIVAPPAAPSVEEDHQDEIDNAVEKARVEDARWNSLFERLDRQDERINSLEVAAIVEELEEEEEEQQEEEEPQRPPSEDEEPKNEHGFYKKWGEE
jgi:uncharacterized protein YdcH (DUF465 family)